MNRILTLLASVIVTWTAVAQVMIPFEVPSPTWKGILTSKVEKGPLVFQKPNPSSDNLIQIEAGEETKYKLAQKYYTALGRERYGMYRVTNKLEKIQEELKN